jgi:hypothetical protein
MKKNEREVIRWAATAVEAVVIIKTYATNGYSELSILDEVCDRVISISDLESSAEQEVE